MLRRLSLLSLVTATALALSAPVAGAGPVRVVGHQPVRSSAARVDTEEGYVPVPEGMVLIPAGTFIMGSPPDEPGRFGNEVQHQVTLTHSFFMATTEVTQGEFETLMGYSVGDCDSCAADVVDWHEAIAYCNARSLAEGLEPVYTPGEPTTWNRSARGYRLATEAEWEYACRAGTTTATYNGQPEGHGCAADPILDPIAWYCGHTLLSSHPTALLLPNAFGLYDMLGNSWEWVWDRYVVFTSDPVVDPVSDPLPPPHAEYHVIRGGCNSCGVMVCRAARRDKTAHSWPYHNGIRLVRDIN